MCGIFGAIGPVGSGPPLAEHDAARLRDTMADRGPDGAGLHVRGHVVLAHRRLSIRDLDAPNQPWLSDDRSIAVVYNGEIYNDAELRSELTRFGCHFKTRCDTEVIPAAYRIWGSDFIKRLRGDFAIGLYDFHKNRLLLARDRCGTKPLFYAWIGRSLVFASSIRAIRRHPEFKAEPDWAALSHYLTTLRLTLDRQTVFRGISTLQPAERLLYENGRVLIDRYWTPPAEDECDDFEAAADAFEDRLREAIKIRLTGDVPSGLFLSGGVDSNAIACVVRDETGHGLAAGCGEGHDAAAPTISGDASHAAQAARYTGCDLTTTRLGAAEYLETWLGLLDDYETPVSTPTDAILFHLSETMKRSVGFVLGGEGADELLCGYAVAHHSGHDFDRSQRLQNGNWSPASHVRRLFGNSLRRCYGRESFPSPIDHYFALNSLISTEAKPHLLQNAIWEAADQDESMRSYYRMRLEE
ncbi:MAG: asparagine synthase (glutamine-hydrolyzing) [Planctomycetaceae bacterium]|nr:asparagine synthase (glutamine-hydrolyzing) [Planctomycetaceae bacterium]